MATIITSNGNINTAGALNLAVSQSNTFKVDGYSAVFITASGAAPKVGINTTNPLFPLDVNGNVNVNGNISSSGAITAKTFTGSFSGSITNAVSSSYALSTSMATNLNGGSVFASTLNVASTSSFNSDVVIMGNLNVMGTSSIINMTSSQLNVGANKITVNAYTPFQRYAGISAQDSGSSSGTTGSLYWDSLNNYWLFQGESPAGAFQSSSVIIGGPIGTLGNETTLTTNKIPKVVAATNIGDSLLSDNGTSLSYTGAGGANLTGPITASAAKINGAATFNGALNGISDITLNGTISGSTNVVVTNITSSGIKSNTTILSTGLYTNNIYPSSSTSVSFNNNNVVGVNVFSASSATIPTLYATTVGITSLTASVLGTSSWASNAVTASYYGNSIVNGQLPTQISVTGVTASLLGIASTASYVNGNIFTSTNLATSASYALTASYIGSGSVGNFPYWTNNNKLSYSSPITINTSSGLIGIGIGSPQFTLDVNSSFGCSLGDFNIYAGPNGARTNLNLQQDGGNVGIGTAYPYYTLDVVGGIGFTDNLYKNGEVYVPTLAYTASYVDAANITTGTLNNSRLPSQISVNGVTASLVGNTIGTASYASSADYAINASSATHADSATNADYATSAATAFSANGALTATSASYVNGNIFTSTNLVTSASYAITASYIKNAVSASYVDAASITTGTLNNSRLPSQISVTGVTASFLGNHIGNTTGTASWSSYSVTASYYSSSIVNGQLPTQISVTGVTASLLGVASTASYVNGTIFGSTNPVTSASYALTSSYSIASANAFINNGNSFGGTATIGTNDAQSLVLETNNTARLTIDTNGVVSSSVKIVPTTDANSAYTLGTTSLRWNDVFAVQSTIGALFETGLKTYGIGEYPTGTILSWKNGELYPSNEEFDEMVMGVVQKGKDEPIVFGAEPVLVTGKVNEGDYIVTSNKTGHGQGIPRGTIHPLELYSKVIGQALENGDGESHTIKAMIRKM